MTCVVGVVANPVAGTDVRRLVSAASGSTVAGRVSVIERVVSGALAAGAAEVVVVDDPRGIAAQAVRGVDGARLLDAPVTGSRADSRRGAAVLAELGASALVVVGGDGTNRDVALGWSDAPLVPLSSGTNNAFPVTVEPTVAGMAAGAVASGAVPAPTVRTKVLRIGDDDLALVDCALVAGGFTGSRAVWDPDGIRELVLAIAEVDRIGLSAIGGAVSPLDRTDEGALHLRLATGAEPATTVRAPILPGRFAEVRVASARRFATGATVTLTGPGVLAVDGERDRVLAPGEQVEIRVERTGPRVIDVPAVLRRWADAGGPVVPAAESAKGRHAG